MAIEYLYKPEAVARVLQKCPSLVQKLAHPSKEGQKSASFLRLRKTSREIYRILSSQHYPNLVVLLNALERCLKHGWEQPSLLRTRGKKEFDSALAELLVAEFFLRRGFTIQGFDDRKGTTHVPDMLVTSGPLSVSVEVYCPRDWNGLDNFLAELRLGILHLDVPWDYRCNVTMRTVRALDSTGKLLRFDPWQFSDANENPADRWTKIKPILSQMEAKLSRATRPQIVTRFQYGKLNTLIEMRVSRIQKSQGDTPARIMTFLEPTLTGYAPEGMFDRLVERRVLKKIQKGQAQSLTGNHFRALIVDMSRLVYTSVFSHRWYLQQFGQSVKKYLNPDEIDVDLVVFCCPGPRAGADLAIPVVFRKPSFPEDVFERLFGGNFSFNALSAEVFIDEGLYNRSGGSENSRVSTRL